MDRKLLLPRVSDAVRLCETSSSPKFLGFLTSEEAAEAVQSLNNSRVKLILNGGYSEAERVYLGILPDWCDNPEEFFPFCSLTFSYRPEDILTHRDFLGALMSLGITRESIGDILIEKGRAVVFLNKELSGFVLEQISKVGRVGVKVHTGHKNPLPNTYELVPVRDTVASARLDCVVASLINSGRKNAVDLIENGLVAVNSIVFLKSTKMVLSGDKITIKGYGKFIVNSLDKRTKKDRLVLEASKYK